MDKKLTEKILRIPGWLSKNEGQLLAYFVKRADGPIVEIGSFQGKSTIYMARVTKQKIYAIDPHLGKLSYMEKGTPTFAAFKRNLKRFGVEKLVIPIRKTSAEANKDWQRPIGLLHVDGLHEYEFAKQDLQMWLPFLIDGGVMVCHDAFTFFPDVFRAVREEIFQKGDWQYLGALDSQIFAVKGRPKNFWQKINVARQKFFLTLASTIWHNEKIPQPVRFLVVNRLLKIFFLNKFMFRAILKLDL